MRSEALRFFPDAPELRHEQERTWINAGEPSITGLVEEGRSERKDICEDEKINDPDSGLLMVADGVSLSAGSFASQETARIVQEELGQKLDEQLARIANSETIPREKKPSLIDSLIRSEIKAALVEANARIRTRAKTDRNIGRASTTVSVSKIKKMPDGSHRLYVANVGDSRIYLMRQGRLVRLTQDDNYISASLKEGRITQEQANQLEEASSIDELPDALRFLFKHRHRLTRAIGELEDEDINVRAVRVYPDDRLLLTSDGVTDQIRETNLATVLASHEEDRAAERQIQGMADEIALRGTDPRAKADDISAVVATIKNLA